MLELPESDIYHSKVLYKVYHAKQAITKTKQLFSGRRIRHNSVYQSGIENVVLLQEQLLTLIKSA
jgi:hypothetical protein